MGSSKKQSADEPEVAGIDENDTSSNQEAVPVPYFAGEVRLKAIWISPVYNQYSIPAPSSGGKK